MFNSIWYKTLIKPPFLPPNWIFSPVWTLLYILMFSSLFIFSISEGEGKFEGYLAFFVQFLLNLLWTPAFFGLKSIGLALIIVILLDITLIFTIKEFYCYSKTAAYLLIPYFLWVLFATYLNIGYYVLN